ncbi:MAG: 2-oxoacid:ferredoxin oxidoreductase subunit beta [Proteobacteria bacterium]|nr:2-oxoacid:ferredoxin oxidoreductase subunit beta [Pseudomonadota bacterium]
MTYLPKPKVKHPGLAKNELGLTFRDYEGALSTLCAGCGHDSVTAAIIQACWHLSIAPHQVAKMSGIGCSSKTPAYFLNAAHGFNSVHGRMPSVTTGAYAANRNLIYLGVSGDGDTASIGLGQFVHGIRRKLNMLYIVENNGVYGLTKGQFSATADLASPSKTGGSNPYHPIDVASLAISMGAGFVARSFSGDKEQLVPLIMAGLKHHGFAVIDVISPCVTFNNHEGSTKSYTYVREHEEEIVAADLILPRQEITANYHEGATHDITMHDGSTLRLHKMAKDYDPCSRQIAMATLQERQEAGALATGLLYIDPEAQDMHDVMNTVPMSLRDLTHQELCPGKAGLKALRFGGEI